MAKLTKSQARRHADAESLLAQDKLSIDEKLAVLEGWREDATNVNSTAGAFFTPWGLAVDATIGLNGQRRVLDLCAGAGTLSLAASLIAPSAEFTCVEVNPDYVRVGRKIMPDAEWIEASVFDLPDLGRFDVVISNPPFGKISRDGDSPRYRRGEFEMHVIDVASTLAPWGVFIVPQASAGFSYSGAGRYERSESAQYKALVRDCGIELDAHVGIDTALYADEWHGASPRVEVVAAEFPEREEGSVVSLFELGGAA